jgi:thiol-disulfide isomerase/thioredoxin
MTIKTHLDPANSVTKHDLEKCPLAVLFTSHSCSACRAVKSVLQELKEEDELDFFEVFIDDLDAAEWMDDGLSPIPVLRLYSRLGVLPDIIRGVCSKDKILQLL